jgi:hypothetical protein
MLSNSQTLTTYILYEMAPRGAIFAMISNISAPGTLQKIIGLVGHNFRGTSYFKRVIFPIITSPSTRAS